MGYKSANQTKAVWAGSEATPFATS